ncbi:MAG TPA: hypothetical protein PLE30_11495 [Candidatus Kapabacteria bacterium]|nr:hypothetical protein [Candidatus Kapabacteria bacterium]
MNKIILVIIFLIFVIGCTKDYQNEVIIKKIEKEYLDTMPDNYRAYYSRYLFANKRGKKVGIDSIYNFVHLLDPNFKKSISIIENLNKLPKNYHYDIKDIGIFGEYNYVFYIGLDIFYDTKYFYKVYFIFNPDFESNYDVVVTDLNRKTPEHDSLLSQCFQLKSYETLQIQVDWEKYLKYENLVDSTSDLLKIYKSKFKMLQEKK